MGKRRRAERREAGFPVKLLTHRGFVDALVRDVSRTGVRLRVQAADSGIDPTTDLAVAEEAVCALLPRPFSMTLEYERFGPLIQKLATLRRVGLPVDAGGAIDICCSFGKALEDDELALLALQLPPLVEDVQEWHEAEAGPKTLEELIGSAPPLEDEPDQPPPPRQAYRASITAAGSGARTSLHCETDLVTAFGVRVRVEQRRAFGAALDPARTATAVGKAFVRRFGDQLELRLYDSRGEVWNGTLRVSGFELPRDRPDLLLISFSFGRRLRLSEMRTLGLAQPGLGARPGESVRGSLDSTAPGSPGSRGKKGGGVGSP